MAAAARRRAVEDQLHAPRQAMDDATLIDLRLSVDIAAIFAAALVVTDVDLIRLGWAQAQIDDFRRRQLAPAK